MQTLRTSEAAALLGISPNTLRTWERRFGFPRPQRTTGQHRVYAHAEIAALRDALAEGASISSAVAKARSGLSAPDVKLLGGALVAFEFARADAAMDAAVALRPLEDVVEELLLPTLRTLADRHGTDSAPWAVAQQWATEWLRRVQRYAVERGRGPTVIVGDATRGVLDPAALDVAALQLFLARSGARVLVLPITGLVGLGDLAGTMAPEAVVIVGDHDLGDAVARWAYAVRSVAGPVPIAVFHRALQRLRTAGPNQLSERPSYAATELLALVELRRQRAASANDEAAAPRPAVEHGKRGVGRRRRKAS